jgi:CheY-like chemotaxis protein
MTQRPDSTITCSTRIAARRLGVSVRTARLWAENGKLKAWSGRGARPRIVVSSIDRLLRTRTPATGQGLLIVCEDDERSALAALAGSAVPAMHTDFACNGFEALIRIGAEAPAVVLTHLGLAGMDAFRMLHALAAHARERGTLVVVLLEAECERAMVRTRLPDEIVLLGPADDPQARAATLKACVEDWRSRRGGASAMLDGHH